jgi:hypothetical protein
MIGCKTLDVLTDEMGMSLTDCEQLIARGKMPVPFTSDEMVEEGGNIPSGNPYHVRDTIDQDIWYRLHRTKRLRLGYEFYNHPARTADFLGFDSDNVAVYTNH